MMSKQVVAYVPFPQQTEHTAARMLRGHRMGALKDGWLLVYEDLETPPSPALAGELCIVMTDDHKVLARFVHPGAEPGKWDLLTANGEQLLDVRVTWSQPVTLIVPFRPTPEQRATMGQVS